MNIATIHVGFFDKQQEPDFNGEFTDVVIHTEDKNLLPKHQTIGSAGLDLRSDEDRTLHGNTFTKISTGVKLYMKENYVGSIRSRSGLMSKGIFVPTGTIDSDYRGIISVIMYNFSHEAHYIQKYDRIAQLLISPVLHFKNLEINKERHEKGFGSTGT